MSYTLARTLDEATRMIAGGKARLIAGGTDFYPGLVKGAALPPLVDLSRVAEMRGIAATQPGWRIGGAATWTDIIAADLPPAFDGLKAAAREVGSVQIQNTGTLAGNLCNASPAADGVPCLLALDAFVTLASAQGSRDLPLDQFITGVRQTMRRPDEILTAITVPDLPDGARGAFEKLGARRYLVISITMVSVVIVVQAGRIAHARVAVGACSPVAQRQRGLEAALIGQDPATVTVTADMLGNLSPIADVRGDPAYRLTVAAAQCTRAIRGLA